MNVATRAVLDDTHAPHPAAVRALEGAGEWLRVNGEPIYATRARKTWSEGEKIRVTRRKDHRALYALERSRPGDRPALASGTPADVTPVAPPGS